MNAITLNGKQSVSKPRPDRDAIPDDYASRQYNHLKTLLSRRCLLDVITDAVDDVSDAIDIAHDAAERLPDLAQVRRLHVQKIMGRTGVVARAGDRFA